MMGLYKPGFEQDEQEFEGKRVFQMDTIPSVFSSSQEDNARSRVNIRDGHTSTQQMTESSKSYAIQFLEAYCLRALTTFAKGLCASWYVVNF